MNAQQLKNAILQEAIEGRLVPQDPNDGCIFLNTGPHRRGHGDQKIDSDYHFIIIPHFTCCEVRDFAVLDERFILPCNWWCPAW